MSGDDVSPGDMPGGYVSPGDIPGSYMSPGDMPGDCPWTMTHGAMSFVPRV